jgi:threonine dehydrogenase-like Zn-dependent dehydrogenase
MTKVRPQSDAQLAQAEAFWFVRPGEGAICDEFPPMTSSAYVSVRALYSGLCVETHALIFHGHAQESFARALDTPNLVGQLPAPAKFGDSVVGVVEDGPPALFGRRVFVPHPHQTLFSVPKEQVTPLPIGMSERRALLISELERALSAVWAARPQLGEEALVVGEGPAALLVAYIAHTRAQLKVTLCPTSPLTAEIAARLGLSCCDVESAPCDLDLVWHISPREGALHWCLGRAGAGGRVVDLSYHLTPQTPLLLPGDVAARGVDLTFAHPSRHAPSAQRWSRPQRRQLAAQLLSDPALDALLEPTPIEFEDLPSALSRLCRLGSSSRYQVVRYPGAAAR